MSTINFIQDADGAGQGLSIHSNSDGRVGGGSSLHLASYASAMGRDGPSLGPHSRFSLGGSLDMDVDATVTDTFSFSQSTLSSPLTTQLLTEGSHARQDAAAGPRAPGDV